VPEELYRRLESAALEAYRALGCRDWCRVDLRLDDFRIPNVVELNPLPGVIPDPRMNSCFPKAARAAGMSFDDLIRTVVRIAAERLSITALASPGARVAIA
jgi:D-alanine-D-alanine ligase